MRGRELVLQREEWFTGHIMGLSQVGRRKGTQEGVGPGQKWKRGGTSEPVLVGKQVLQKQNKTCRRSLISL